VAVRGGIAQQERGRVAVRAGRGFDGERALRGAAAILVEDGRIVGVEAGAAKLPEGWRVVEFPNATVLPGLIDMHVHLCGDGRDGALERLPGFGEQELAAVIDEALRRQVAAGVTTVRGLGDRRWAVLDRRNAGLPGSPTILASGPPITSVDGHCWNKGGEAAGQAQLRAAVRERAERGVDVVKVMGSGGGTTAATDMQRCQFNLGELRLMVDEAHRLGLPVTAHGLAAVEQALAAGGDGIEHCTWLTGSGPHLSPPLAGALAGAQVVVCPTLGRAEGVSPPPGVLAMLERAGLSLEVAERKRARLFAELHRHGVVLVSGSDAGIGANKPHGILPRSLAALLDTDVAAVDALASATSVAARHAGLSGRKGRLRPGHDADLLLVDGDPLTDMDALTRIVAVMVSDRGPIRPPATRRIRFAVGWQFLDPPSGPAYWCRCSPPRLPRRRTAITRDPRRRRSG
jgi:imidazolonepropionase-like amidohydrolase